MTKHSVIRCLLLTMLILFSLNSVVFADKVDSLMSKVTFDPPSKTEEFDGELAAVFDAPVAGFEYGNLGSTKYYTTSMGLIKSYYTITTEGVSVSFTNRSNKVIILKWSESSLSVGSFSGLPFLSDMRYKDARKPDAMPDSLIAPGQTIRKDVYISRVSYDNGWSIKGEPILRDKSTIFTLVLKIINSSGNTQYISMTSNPVVIQE